MAAADETQAGVDDDSLAYAAQCIWPTAPPPDAEQVTSALSVCASQVLRAGFLGAALGSLQCRR
jgi:hypothetical protein